MCPAPAPEPRRTFLGWLLAVATSTVTAVLAAPLVRLTIHPLRAATTAVLWSDAGPVPAMSVDAAPARVLLEVEQRDGWRVTRATKPVYLVPGADAPRVLSAVCPHLGCVIGWDEVRGQFLCPCHVGVFARDGALIAGPPPRGMDELESRVENGRLLVRYRYFRQLVPTREVVA